MNAFDAALAVLQMGEMTEEQLHRAMAAGLDAHGFGDIDTYVSTRANRTLGRLDFKWDRNPRTHGRTATPVRMMVSLKAAVMRPREEVANTIAHEVAHAIAGHSAGHDRFWKSACGETGAKPERCSTGKGATATYRFRTYCVTCRTFVRSNASAPRARKLCGTCSTKLFAVDLKDATGATTANMGLSQAVVDQLMWRDIGAYERAVKDAAEAYAEAAEKLSLAQAG